MLQGIMHFDCPDLAFAAQRGLMWTLEHPIVAIEIGPDVEDRRLSWDERESRRQL